NAFAMLLADPREVTVIEPRPAQLELIELKKNAIEALSFDEFMDFFWGSKGFHAHGRLDRSFEIFRQQAIPRLWSVQELEAMTTTDKLELQRILWRRANSEQLRDAGKDLGVNFLKNFARLIETQLISRNPYLFYFLTGRPLSG